MVEPDDSQIAVTICSWLLLPLQCVPGRARAGTRMSDQAFADGLGAISVTGTTVRLDFVVIAPGEASGQAKFAFQQRLIMPLDGFLRAAAKMQEVAQTLAHLASSATQTTPSPAVTEPKTVPAAAPKDKARFP